VKTGSTDRHHLAAEPDADEDEAVAEVVDEPIVAPTPTTRRSSPPRSYRDLDSIPDDYD
jgi:hypothetical protein